MFNQEQLQILNSNLDTNRIKTRNKGNIQLSYIEGHSVIETANQVFGFGNWDYSISKLEQVSSEINSNQNNVLCYKATVKVLVHDKSHEQNISREDVGFGTGVAKTLADAHEGAAKEAVTDALKRALRSFGNQFGNSLYSKDKNQNYQNQQSANNNYPQNQSYQTPYQHQSDFTQLTNVGLTVVEQNGLLLVEGQNQYEYKDTIRNSGFRWDAHNKVWYMQQRVAS
jgi:DNA repair and recombination protein RAD52